MYKKYILAAVMVCSFVATPASAETFSPEKYAFFVDKIQALETQIAELIHTQAQLSASQTGSFTVYVDDVSVYATNTIDTKGTAEYVCSQYAFNPAYMWTPVRCEFMNDTIYDNIFVAG